MDTTLLLFIRAVKRSIALTVRIFTTGIRVIFEEDQPVDITCTVRNLTSARNHGALVTIMIGV